MKLKKITLAMTVAVNVVACSSSGGSGGEARTPNAQDFSSPTGTLTNDNANQVVQVFFNVSRHEAGGYPGVDDLSDLNEIASSDCNNASAEGTSGSVDMECWFGIVAAKSKCTGSGMLTYISSTGSASYTTFEDEDVSLHCPAGVFTSEAYETTVNGEVKVNFPMPPPVSFGVTILCANVTETLNGTARTSNYCESSDVVSINQDDENILCYNGSGTNDDCTNVIVHCKDVNGDATITCDAAPSSGISNCINPFQTASNCTVSH